MPLIASGLALRWARPTDFREQQTATVQPQRRANEDHNTARLAEEPRTSLQDFELAVVVLAPAFALLVCVLRAYIRVKMGGLRVDDWLMFAAMVLAIMFSGFSWPYIKDTYVGIHDADVPTDVDPKAGMLWHFAAGQCYRPILGLAKISALLFLVRLARHSKRLLRFIWAQIVLNILLTLSIMLLYIFSCDPVGHDWELASLAMNCDLGHDMMLVSSTTTIFTDFLVLVVPFWILKGIRMPCKVKCAILSIFLLGLLVTAAGVCRLVFAVKLYFLPPDLGQDQHFTNGYVVMVAESNLAIITASAPVLWPLARRWWPGLFAGLHLSRGYQGRLPTIEDVVGRRVDPARNAVACDADAGRVPNDVPHRRRRSFYSWLTFFRTTTRDVPTPETPAALRRADESGEKDRWRFADRTIGGTEVPCSTEQRGGAREGRPDPGTDERSDGSRGGDGGEHGRLSPYSDMSDLSGLKSGASNPELPQTPPRQLPSARCPRRKDLSQVTGMD